MKRIEFVAPVESMRGNLSGKQDLVYNDNDNKAFEAPTGRQYAKNYQPRFIGAKRASDGHKYFAVKTKSATKITNATKLNMALLGASAVIYNGINRLEQYGTTEQKVNIDIIRQEWMSMAGVTFEEGTSWKKFLMDRIRVMLASHAQYAEFGSTLKTKLLNPYYVGTAPTPTAENLVVDIPQTILVKFWSELAVSSDGGAPIVFTINGLKGLAFNGWDWARVGTMPEGMNIFNIAFDELDQSFVVIDGGNIPKKYVLNGTAYVIADDLVSSTAKYVTTTEQPS